MVFLHSHAVHAEHDLQPTDRGTEAIFGRVPGVITTAVGFSNGLADYDQIDNIAPSYEEVSTGDTHLAEVVRVNFDPKVRSMKRSLALLRV